MEGLEAGKTYFDLSTNSPADARRLAAIAAERWSSDQPAEPFRPLYLRPPDAKASKNGGGIRPRKGP